MCIWKRIYIYIYLPSFHQTFFDNSCYNINICILIIFDVCVFKKEITIFVFNSARFASFYYHVCIYEIIDKIRQWTSINLWDLVFVISSSFLPILLTSFSIGTDKVMNFSVFSPKQVTSLKIFLLAPLW